MLPEEERVTRVKVVENFLAAGIPLRKIDHLRGLLEARGHRLTKSSGLSELFPTVHAIAKKDLLVDLGQVPCPGITTPSSLMVLPVKVKLSPSSFALLTGSGRPFSVLSGSTSLPSPLQAPSYHKY